MVQHCDRVVHLDVESQQDPLELLPHLLVHHDLPVAVLQLVSGAGLGDGPADSDRIPVELLLVSLLASVEQLDLHLGAGLAGPDELLVAGPSRSCPGWEYMG